MRHHTQFNYLLITQFHLLLSPVCLQVPKPEQNATLWPVRARAAQGRPLEHRSYLLQVPRGLRFSRLLPDWAEQLFMHGGWPVATRFLDSTKEMKNNNCGFLYEWGE